MITFESVCARDVPDPRTVTPHVLPLYLTSSYDFESIDHQIEVFSKKAQGHVYSRYGNPTVEAVAKKIADLEVHGSGLDAHGIMMSSGMAAIHVLMLSTMKAGDKVLTQGNLYGGTTELLMKIGTRCGIETILTDLSDADAVEETLKADPSIKLVYFETPSNPTLQCIDIAAISDICQRHGRYSAIDNTFSTPYLQQPFRFGVDFIIHSTTKYLNGHGNSIAGVLVGKDVEFMKTRAWQTMVLIGTNPGPLDAWLVHQGMKTLPLRMDRHCENAMTLALFLEEHDRVAKVNYTGLRSHPDHVLAKAQMKDYGGMLSFEVDGGYEGAIGVLRKIKFCKLAPTLGDVDTLVLHPVSSSHRNIDPEIRERNGITDGLIRVSVGIEGVEDIIGDLEQALNQN